MTEKYLGRHPEPPKDLATRKLRTYTLARGQQLWRIHWWNKSPVFFGKTASGRFDSPDSSFGVLYVGLDEYCAFVETFGQRTGCKFVTEAELKQRRLSSLKLKRDLQLIDVAGEGGLALVGADSRLFSDSHPLSQRWAQALHDHESNPAGIIYPARHDSSKRACALFDCVAPTSFETTNAGSLLEVRNTKLLAKILDTYGFSLIDS